jgi:hypothetical protein
MYRNEKVAPLIDALNELSMPMMASTLDGLYRSKNFLEMDHLSLLTAMIEPEYSAHTTKKLNNRLKRAGLISFPGQISDCMDSGEREYFPTGITESLGEMSFIRDGMNICILGPSDSGKSYLAKSLGIEACHDYRVAYHHCESLLEELVNLKGRDYGKYQRKIKFLVKLDLLILDDFLLHTISDEREIKVLHELLEVRSELSRSVIVCSQREPKSWTSMMLNDEVSSNAILKRVTKHYTVVINPKNGG